MTGSAELERSSDRFAEVAAGLLVGFYILLPLDRGFPRPSVLGHPLSAAIIATVAVGGLFLIRSRGRIFRYARDRYFLLQSLFFVLLILSSLGAASALVALHQALLYWTTFGLNYVVIRYAIRNSDGETFIFLILACAALAALIGVLSPFGVDIPVYASWYQAYFSTEAPDILAGPARGLGTLNNPILFGAAMVLCIPFAVDALRGVRRNAFLLLIMAAAVLTASRTVLIALAALLIGALVIYRAQAWLRLAAVAVLATVLLSTPSVLRFAANNEQANFLTSRLGLGDDVVAAAAISNVSMRTEALHAGWSEMINDQSVLHLLFGRGLMSSVALGEKVDQGYRTVDDTYLTTAYEEGTIGLLLLLGAFAATLWRTRSAASESLFWYSVPALFAMGISFDFESYSTFNILAVASLAIVCSRWSRQRRRVGAQVPNLVEGARLASWPERAEFGSSSGI